MHIIEKDEKISPSAFIPFCEFGGNMDAVGKKIDQFDITVCNSFQATVINDQLCYEVDLNKFSDKDSIDRELKLGFNFIMDYNEDRQIKFDWTSPKFEINLATSAVYSDEMQQALIYLNTVG